MKIVIKEKEIELKFSYKVLKLLAQKWSCKGIQDVFNKIAIIGTVGANEFDMVEVLTDIINVGAVNAGVDVEVTEDEIFEQILSDPNMVTPVISAFMESIPQPSQQSAPKKKAVKK